MRQFGIGLFLLILALSSCGQQEARKPVEVKSGTFIRESVARNKELLAREEKLIRDIISADTANVYRETEFGAWYYYDIRSEEATPLPEADDRVTMTYNLNTFSNDTIYSASEIGVLEYRVDKEDYFPGLQQSVKLLKAGETATFLYPSSLAYGYHGDNNKIGTNIPLRATITLMSIEKIQDNIQN